VQEDFFEGRRRSLFFPCRQPVFQKERRHPECPDGGAEELPVQGGIARRLDWGTHGLLLLNAAFFAAGLAFVGAAAGAGFAFVGAAFLAGFTGEGGAGEGGEGEKGQNRFHSVC
jgi:hypothetical protein